jgi:hypothetical protein
VPALEVGSEPTQPSVPVPPDAVQEAAPVEVQLSEVLWPIKIAAGDAVKPATVAGAGVTVSVVVALTLFPCEPTHVSVYVYTPGVVETRVGTALPSNAFAPVHEPLAVQVLALTVDHVKYAELPATTCNGRTAMLTVTGGGVLEVDTVTSFVLAELPPGPVQVSV